MSYETSISTLNDLNSSWPAGTDGMSEGDNHIRNIKIAVRLLRTGVLGAVPPTQPTIDSSGTISIDASVMEVKPPSGSSGGTLQFLTPGTAYVGSYVMLFAQSASTPITVKHQTSGSNHIETADSADVVLDTTWKHIILRQKSGKWVEVSRFIGPAGTASTRTVGASSGSQIPDRDAADGRYARLDKTQNIFVDSVTDEPALLVQRTGSSDPATGLFRAESSQITIGATNNVRVSLYQDNVERAYFETDGGMVVGAPVTGGLGTGTLNTQGVYTEGLQHTDVLISESTISSVSHIDLTLPTSGYRMLRLLLDGFYPASDGDALEGQFSLDGSTFVAAGYQSSIEIMRSSGGTASTNATTEVMLTHPGEGQSSNGLYTLTLEALMPIVGSKYQPIWGTVQYSNGSRHTHGRFGSQLVSIGSPSKLRIKYAAGNISAGRVSLIGVL